MFPFFETIRITDGTIMNLQFHQERMLNTLNSNYKSYKIPPLESLIIVPTEYATGTVKCKILYNDSYISLSFNTYQKRNIRSLKVVYSDNIEYQYKFTDRTMIEELMQKREQCDDILIVKNGKVTESSYANIVFTDGSNWYTPDNPLHKGTTRARLIKEERIIEKSITLSSLEHYKHYCLINAMLDDQFTNLLPVCTIIH